MSKTMPKFKNEVEFAAWAESTEGRAFMNQQLERQIKKGAFPQGRAAALLKAAARSSPSVALTLRMPPEDVEGARAIAGRKGIPYQTWIKMVVHEAVERERKR